MTPDQVLDRAADVIDELGHAKGFYQNQVTGAVCALGALNIAKHGSIWFTEPNEAKRVLGMAVGGRISEWNDAHERTKDEVTSTMRAVAATLRAQRGSETPREMTSTAVETRQAEVVCAP